MIRKKSVTSVGISIVAIFFCMVISVNADETQNNIEGGEEKFNYDDKGRRDPFWPLVKPTGEIVRYENEFSITDLLLEGIMLGDGGKNIAIINGRIVQENDKVGQFKIHRIEKEKVILFKNKIKYELNIKKEE
ncbi:MAG: hypothetical protein K8S27_13180 [Candidatus Omnitrophica bacterium]|nr:hypothetical protein [Candidatus Omnitrophota bacterium]